MSQPACSKLGKETCEITRGCTWVPRRKPGCVVSNQIGNHPSKETKGNTVKQVKGTKHNVSTTPFKVENLPIHVQQHAWSFVHDPKDLGHLQAASKHFRQTAPSGKALFIKQNISPLLQGFAELIDGNPVLHNLPNNGYASFLIEAKLGDEHETNLNTLPSITTDPYVNSNSGKKGQLVLHVFKVELKYSFKTRELVLMIWTVENMKFRGTIPLASGQDIFGIMDPSRTINLELTRNFVKPHKNHHTLTMLTLEFLKMLLIQSADPRKQKTIFAIADVNFFRLGASTQPEHNAPPMYVPPSIYQILSKLKDARKILSRCKVDVPAGDYDKYFTRKIVNRDHGIPEKMKGNIKRKKN